MNIYTHTQTHNSGHIVANRGRKMKLYELPENWRRALRLVERIDNNNLLCQLVNELYNPWQRLASPHTMAASQFVRLHCQAKKSSSQYKLEDKLLLFAMWIECATYCAPSWTLMTFSTLMLSIPSVHRLPSTDNQPTDNKTSIPILRSKKKCLNELCAECKTWKAKRQKLNTIKHHFAVKKHTTDSTKSMYALLISRTYGHQTLVCTRTLRQNW